MNRTQNLGSYPIGVSLKSAHYQEILSDRPALSFFEFHAENYMFEAGPHHRFLEAIASHYPLSMHGVGLSLGSADGLDSAHLQRFCDLERRYEPALVSEHLAWSVQAGQYLNDLLPLPLNEESFALVSRNIDQLQGAVGRQVLIENPSSYLAFEHSTIPEPEFLNRLCAATGCGLLLDVNNIYVSSRNMGWSAEAYIDEIAGETVGEIHLAGHLTRMIEDVALRIDDHGSAVVDDVWALYAYTLEHIGIKPSLIEWDNNIPDFSVLEAEALKARAIQKTLTNGQKTKAHA